MLRDLRQRAKATSAVVDPIGDDGDLVHLTVVLAAEDLSELAEWMREIRPVLIDPDPAVPLRFVVAVQNEIRKAGLPPASLVLPALPGDDVLKAE